MQYQELAEALPKQTKEWDNDDVIKFLEVMNLNAVIDKFKNLHIKGKDFEKMDRQFVKNQLQVNSLAYMKRIVEWLEFGREEYDVFVIQYLNENTQRILKRQTQKVIREAQEESGLQKVDKSNEKIKEKKEKEKQKQKQKDKDKEKQKQREWWLQIQKQKQNNNLSQYQTQIQKQKGRLSPNNVKFVESNFYLADKTEQKLNLNSYLIVKVGEEYYQVVDVLRIGRQPPENHILISHDSASRFHATITKQSPGQFYIKDLSRFGTYIKMNPRQMISDKTTQILIGNTNIFIKKQRINKSIFDIKVEIPQCNFNQFYQNRSSLTIGRKAKDIKIQDPTISNQHLNIYAVDDQLIIESFEGISYKRLASKQNVRIRNDDVFRIASTLLYCKFENEDDKDYISHKYSEYEFKKL